MFFVFCLAVAAQNCGDVITTSAILNADIGPCTGNGLIIGANDIVLDCNGHSIIGINPAVTTSGIVISSRTGVEIKNCKIQNFRRGISIVKGGSHNLNNNEIHNNKQHGIYISNSSRNQITLNSIFSNKNGGLYIYRSNYNNVTYNDIYNQDFGLTLAYSNTNQINFNNFTTHAYAGISLASTSSINTARGNIITANKDGILINKATQNVIRQNTISTNTEAGIFLLNGINGTIIDNNTITTNKAGIDSDKLSQSRVLISNNRIHYNADKNINIVDGSVVISNNNITNSAVGIGLTKATGYNSPNNFFGNYICWHNMALDLFQTKMSTYQPDFITRNNWCGNSNGIIALI